MMGWVVPEHGGVGAHTECKAWPTVWTALGISLALHLVIVWMVARPGVGPGNGVLRTRDVGPIIARMVAEPIVDSQSSLGQSVEKQVQAAPGPAPEAPDLVASQSAQRGRVTSSTPAMSEPALPGQQATMAPSQERGPQSTPNAVREKKVDPPSVQGKGTYRHGEWIPAASSWATPAPASATDRGDSSVIRRALAVQLIIPSNPTSLESYGGSAKVKVSAKIGVDGKGLWAKAVQTEGSPLPKEFLDMLELIVKSSKYRAAVLAGRGVEDDYEIEVSVDGDAASIDVPKNVPLTPGKDLTPDVPQAFKGGAQR